MTACRRIHERDAPGCGARGANGRCAVEEFDAHDSPARADCIGGQRDIDQTIEECARDGAGDDDDRSPAHRNRDCRRLARAGLVIRCACAERMGSRQRRMPGCLVRLCGGGTDRRRSVEELDARDRSIRVGCGGTDGDVRSRDDEAIGSRRGHRHRGDLVVRDDDRHGRRCRRSVSIVVCLRGERIIPRGSIQPIVAIRCGRCRADERCAAPIELDLGDRAVGVRGIRGQCDRSARGENVASRRRGHRHRRRLVRGLHDRHGFLVLIGCHMRCGHGCEERPSPALQRRLVAERIHHACAELVRALRHRWAPWKDRTSGRSVDYGLAERDAAEIGIHAQTANVKRHLTRRAVATRAHAQHDFRMRIRRGTAIGRANQRECGFNAKRRRRHARRCGGRKTFQRAAVARNAQQACRRLDDEHRFGWVVEQPERLFALHQELRRFASLLGFDVKANEKAVDDRQQHTGSRIECERSRFTSKQGRRSRSRVDAAPGAMDAFARRDPDAIAKRIDDKRSYRFVVAEAQRTRREPCAVASEVQEFAVGDKPSALIEVGRERRSGRGECRAMSQRSVAREMEQQRSVRGHPHAVVVRVGRRHDRRAESAPGEVDIRERIVLCDPRRRTNRGRCRHAEPHGEERGKVSAHRSLLFDLVANERNIDDLLENGRVGRRARYTQHGAQRMDACG